MTDRPGGSEPPQQPSDQPAPAPQPGSAPQPGAAPQPGYWEQQAQAPYPPSYPPQQYVPEHPRATTSLVLGILGILLCQVLAPFAWVIGRRTVEEIDASGGRLGGRGAAQAGYVLGVIGTVILGLAVAFGLIMVVFAVVALLVGSTR